MTTVLIEPVATTKPSARPALSQALPIVIEAPRGGIFRPPARRAPARTRAGVAPPEAHVLQAIWPLIGSAADQAPGAPAADAAAAACRHLRATISAAVAAFRVRLGRIAADTHGADRIAIEDLALTLRVDEAELLGRTIDALAPAQLLAVSLGSREPRMVVATQIVAARLDAHLRLLVQDSRQLGETARARLLEALTHTA